jgi:hypothetical protein
VAAGNLSPVTSRAKSRGNGGQADRPRVVTTSMRTNVRPIAVRPEEAAAMIRVSRSYFYTELLGKRRIPYRKLGPMSLILVEDIEDLVVDLPFGGEAQDP